MKRFGVNSDLIILLSSLFLGLQHSYGQDEQAVSSDATKHAVGGGRWQSVRDAAGERDWQVQIERFDDDSIAGSIVVVGSPYLHKARLEGRVDGGEVYGVLVDDGNRQVGTFSGRVTALGAGGTYTTNEGDSGEWSWEGPTAARSLKPTDSAQ